jgi:asparagine synthase (glutamine-hydrolysing)
MCGISGFLSLAGAPADLALVRRMAATLRHRGPDEDGAWAAGPIALGHQRLRILDLEGGRQPMWSTSGHVVALLNGEIYNYRELRDELRARGRRFATASDTEVLAEAYDVWGEACVDRLNGMFACALWDTQRSTLLLARDRMGEKPLYYAEAGGTLVFGSEARALLEHPAVSREVDADGVVRFLANGYVPDPHSIFRDIRKLPPGHLLTVQHGKVTLRRYWDLEFGPKPRRTDEEWAERVWHALMASVRRRLIADVPVGVLLSGGIDSSAILAAASTVAPGRTLQTFSLGFEESSWDETPYARRVADRFATEHHEVIFTADDARGIVEDLGPRLDEPLADPSFLPTLHLARHTRRHVRVVLGGDGGDEMFCGYPTALARRYAGWLDRVPMSSARRLEALAARLPSGRGYMSADFLVKQLTRSLGYAPEARMQIMMGGLTPGEYDGVIAPALRAATIGFTPHRDLAEVMESGMAHDPLDRLAYHHAKLYLAGQTLVKMDRATMAFALESRAPFLDHTLVGMAAAMPSRLKVRRFTTKYVLKRALRGRLPDEIIDRRKHGFGIPLAAWLRGALRPALTTLLHPDRLARSGFLAPAAVSRLVDEHLTGRRDHRKMLWTLMVFESWREAYGVAPLDRA